MTPFFFGPPSRQLFGVLERRQGPAPARGGVVLAPPFGHEAIRVQRFYRVLAGRLMRRGFDVLRFDYYGTGDSAGDDADVRLSGWSSDIVSAHVELGERAGVPVAWWIGARLGATAAVLAMPEIRDPASASEPPALLLWDPVLDGRAYLNQLRVCHAEALEASFSLSDPGWRRALGEPEGHVDEAVGFAIPLELRRELLALRPEGLRIAGDTRLVLVCNRGLEETAAWARAHPSATVEVLEHDFEWTSDDSLSTALVPSDVLARLLRTVDGSPES